MANLVELAWEAEATAFGEQKWNLLSLGLSLLVNLIEHSANNRYPPSQAKDCHAIR